MKKMMFALATACLLSTAAIAQDNKGKGKHHEGKFDKTEMVKHSTDRTVKELGLNDEQAKQLLDLNTKFVDQMAPRRPEMSAEQKEKMKADREAMRKKHEETRQQYDAELAKILTPEQLKKLSRQYEESSSRGAASRRPASWRSQEPRPSR